MGAFPVVARMVGDEHIEDAVEPIGDGRAPDARVADAFSRIVEAQRSWYWTSPAADLFQSACASAHLGVRLIRSARYERTRARLASSLAESAMFAGRLAFFDLHRAPMAQRCYDVALTATREAGEDALAAAILGHMAFLPGFKGDAARALELVEAAEQRCWYGTSPMVRSWLHCVAAECVARSSKPEGYRRRVALAEESLSTNESAPTWFDFYDESRLDGFAGYCAMVAGDGGHVAIDRLHKAIAGLSPRAVKQLPVLLADLATAHGGAGEAGSLLDRALDILAHDWYATGYQRVGEVIPTLADGAEKSRIHERYRWLGLVAAPSA